MCFMYLFFRMQIILLGNLHMTLVPLCINAFVAQVFMLRLLSVCCPKITIDINHSIDIIIFTCGFIVLIV